jgi:hypothetical protein
VVIEIDDGVVLVDGRHGTVAVLRLRHAVTG